MSIMNARAKTRKRSSVRESCSAKVLSTKLELAFQNLVALQCPFEALGKKSNVTIHKTMFDKPNKPGLIAICYFLFCKLDQKRTQQVFKYCYPPFDKKQEQEFQKVCLSWWKECIKDNIKYKVPLITSTLFMKASGNDVVTFIFAFTSYVLNSHANELCPKDDLVLSPPNLHQNARIQAFQNVSLKSATCFSLSSFFQSVQLSRVADAHAATLADSMLVRYRANLKRIKEIKRTKHRLMENLKIPVSNSHSISSKKDVVERIRTAQNADLKVVRQMWDILISNTNDTGMEREIVRSILSQSTQQETLSAAKLGVKIPSSLIKECNQEVCEKVGPSLYQAEQLNLVSFIRLVNVMLRQILLKLHEGLPNFENSVTVMKAQSILHSKRSANLSRLQQKMEHQIPQLTELNARLRKEVDDCNYKRKLDNETLIPGLPRPDMSDTEKHSTLNNTFDIVTLSPPCQFSDHVPGRQKVALGMQYSPSDLAQVSAIPSLSQESSIYHCKLIQDDPTLDSAIDYPPPLSAANESSVLFPSENSVARSASSGQQKEEDVDLFGSFSSLKQGHLSFGPSSPLRVNPVDANHEGLFSSYLRTSRLGDKSSSIDSPKKSIVMQKVEPRQPALEKLIDRVVDFTLHENDFCPIVPTTGDSPMGLENFDVTSQLDEGVFNSVDKIMRSPPQA